MQVEFLQTKFVAITEKIYEETGIELLAERFKFEILPKQNGALA